MYTHEQVMILLRQVEVAVVNAVTAAKTFFNWFRPHVLSKVAVSILFVAASRSLIGQPVQPTDRWLFVGFKGTSQDGIYYALSRDGYHWAIANHGKPLVRPTVPDELARDPFIQRAPDGTFRMVWTWAWRSPHSIGYASSTDLVRWTLHRQLDVLYNEPTALNAWAPALYYDHGRKRWLLLWSSTIPGRFSGDDLDDGSFNHRIFATTTKDFISFTPAKLFFDPGYSVIDATLSSIDERFVLLFKDERRRPLSKCLKTASGPTMEGPWANVSAPISDPWSEGAAIIRVSGGYLAYYDHYSAPQHYGALWSRDLQHWSDATSKITFPPGLRHGSFLKITQAEYDKIESRTATAGKSGGANRSKDVTPTRINHQGSQ